MLLKDQLTQGELGFLTNKQLQALKEYGNQFKQENKTWKFKQPKKKWWHFRPKKESI